MSAGQGFISVSRVAVRAVVVVLAVLVFHVIVASAAFGADSVYWAKESASGGAVRIGNLDGSGLPGNLGPNDASESAPNGVAIDPVAGKIYWADFGSTASNGAIRVANLDGSGSPANLGPNYASEDQPTAVAINPAAGKIYWTTASGAIRVGNLNGTGSPANLGPNYASEDYPSGIAINPATGKIYWTDYLADVIRVGNLDGSGSPANLGANYASEAGPLGLAIDPAAGKIYWADFSSGAIRVGNLDGSGSPANLGTNYASEHSPSGVAIDPAAGKIYWANGQLSGAIRVGNLDGTGSPANLGTSYANEDVPGFPVLLRAPAGTGAPVVSGGSITGSVLSCSQGSWAGDLLGAFLYRAPASFAYQWSRNGTDIPGAMSSSYTASAVGSYTCRVTATNHAGSSVPQTSTAFAVNAPPIPPARLPSAPVISALSLSPSAFKAAVSGPSAIPAAVRTGTVITYSDTETATATFIVLMSEKGVRKGMSCVKPPKHPRGKKKPKRCTRLVALGSFTHTDTIGVNRLRFTGRIRGHELKPGRYQLRATAKNTAGQTSNPATGRFRIKR